ncbi:hypothetical protein C9F11_42910 (plasmid) [Streptomyces sp. YIM 121038]|uniref:Uncharacterized protein n=1 Tax=Streptomyces alboflavus TaxID=67267 RepID=A0A291W426_9ACTN|nr:MULTISPECIES: hypothetical protein [Streptomyces]ATM24768.1 hypothetical protein SMD44_p10269 [Streptomyces alboflavus]QCX82162.1 hypothetical protein C9F11_42910 [Streptomyces sp. YIM 121038]
MDLFDSTTANASFGALLFGAMATSAVIAGFKYKVLRKKKTFILVFFSVLLVTVNSAGFLGEIAGALRNAMNTAGESAVEQTAGATPRTDPPRSEITPVSAGGAAIGLCGVVWYCVRLYAADWKPADWKEMVGGTVVAICYGTTLGFMGVIVSATTLTGNNLGLWLFGG